MTNVFDVVLSLVFLFSIINILHLFVIIHFLKLKQNACCPNEIEKLNINFVTSLFDKGFAKLTSQL